MSAICCLVSAETVLLGLTTTAMPSLAITMDSKRPSVFSSALTARERLPIWAVPSDSAVIAAPEPVTPTSVVTFGLASLKASVNASHTGPIELEPANTSLPDSAAVPADELSSAGEPGLLPTSPVSQPARSSTDMAAADKAHTHFFMILPPESFFFFSWYKHRISPDC